MTTSNDRRQYGLAGSPVHLSKTSTETSASIIETQLFAEENKALGVDDDTKTLCGLALSGGGIRSATFNLGVLQALAERDLLRGFHYLSTVSGGGYVGGFWSAWRRAQEKAAEAKKEFAKKAEAKKEVAKQKPPKKGQQEAKKETAVPASFPSARSDSIRHLRRFSNFLRPRLPLISFETGRMVAAVVTALAPALAATLGVFGTVLMLWLGIIWLVMDQPYLWSVAAVAGLLLIGHATLWHIWSARQRAALPAKKNQETAAGTRSDAGQKNRDWGPRLVWQLIAIAVSTATWLAGWWLVLLPLPLRLAPTTAEQIAREGHWHWLTVFLPPLTILVGALSLLLIRTFTAAFVCSADSRRRWHGTYDITLAASLYMAVASTFLGLVWLGGTRLAADGVGGIVAAFSVSGVGGGAFAWLRKLVEREPATGAGSKAQAAGPWLLKVVAYLVVAAGLLGVAGVLSRVYGASGISGLGIAATVCVVFGILPFFFDPDNVGLHVFYRSRLARAYLGAATAQQSHLTQEVVGDDFPVTELPEGRPLHLICCAANDLAGDPMLSLHRGAKSAVVSRLGMQVGLHWAPWQYLSHVPTLGSAMTASAAAFNSHMGSKSMRFGQAVTFLLTALNLRLGLWVDNPQHENGKLKQIPRATGFWGLPNFYREMFGQSDLLAPKAFLSDGAHYDNLALYELVRRGCRFIVLCDCGADPRYAFEDLGNAIRRIRTDLGVEISIDPSPLRPGDDGRSSQSVVAGSITYPGGAPGVLLYIKPSLLGSEPADVQQYASRCNDFPQQSTIDQFYDEAQWEAYRKLGEHTMSSVFNRLDRAASESERPEGKIRWALAQAQHELLPPSDVDMGVRMRLEQAWQILEADVASNPETGSLAREVLGTVAGPPENAGANHNPLTPSVALLRRALQIMEVACAAYGLNTGLTKTGAMGWVNRMGRWATAPTFRAWWPWLAPSHSRDLVSYLETQFKVGPLRRGEGHVRPLEKKENGFARERWRAERGAKPKKKKIPLGFFQQIADLDEVMIGLAWVAFDESDGQRVATWQWPHFFIPSGLWGIGIGERFLKKLISYLKYNRTAPCSTILVTLSEKDEHTAALVALCADHNISLRYDKPEVDSPGHADKAP